MAYPDVQHVADSEKPDECVRFILHQFAFI